MFTFVWLCCACAFVLVCCACVFVLVFWWICVFLHICEILAKASQKIFRANIHFQKQSREFFRNKSAESLAYMAMRKHVSTCLCLCQCQYVLRTIYSCVMWMFSIQQNAVHNVHCTMYVEGGSPVEMHRTMHMCPLVTISSRADICHCRHCQQWHTFFKPVPLLA